jgi:hypothetical protein
MSAKGCQEILQPGVVQFAFAKDVRGHNDMAGTRIQKYRRVLRRHSAAHVHATRVSLEGVKGGLIVPGAQGDDVAAHQVVLLVKAGKIVGGSIRFKIDDGLIRSVVGQRAANNLHNATVAKINAGSESHGFPTA